MTSKDSQPTELGITDTCKKCGGSDPKWTKYDKAPHYVTKDNQQVDWLDEVWDKYSDVNGGYETIDWAQAKQAIQDHIKEATEFEDTNINANDPKYDYHDIYRKQIKNSVRRKIRNQLGITNEE